MDDLFIQGITLLIFGIPLGVIGVSLAVSVSWSWQSFFIACVPIIAVILGCYLYFSRMNVGDRFGKN